MMRLPWLSRLLAFRILPFLLLAGACNDVSAPSPGPLALELRLMNVTGAVATQRAVDFSAWLSDGAPITKIEAVAVDGAQRKVDVVTQPTATGVIGWLALPGGGTTTLEVTATDSAGRTAMRQISLTWDVLAVDYRAVVLPDLGHGAAISWVGEDGTMAGWVARGDGRKRPAIWRDGALTEIPVNDSADASAVGVADDGQVLVQFGWAYPSFATCTRARVWRAGLGERLLGCGEITGLRRGHEVLLADGHWSGPMPKSTRIIDLTTDARVDSIPARILVANDEGQSAGVQPCCYFNQGLTLHVFGWLAARIPPGIPPLDVPNTCDFNGRWRRHIPRGLDEQGNLVTDDCGRLMLHDVTGSIWLSRVVPGDTQVAMSRTGRRVARLDPATSTTHLWQFPDGTVQRVALDRDDLRLQSLVHLSATGTIAANATIGSDSTPLAVLLHPVSTP